MDAVGDGKAVNGSDEAQQGGKNKGKFGWVDAGRMRKREEEKHSSVSQLKKNEKKERANVGLSEIEDE